jgi:hypothetical protein
MLFLVAAIFLIACFVRAYKPDYLSCYFRHLFAYTLHHYSITIFAALQTKSCMLAVTVESINSPVLYLVGTGFQSWPKDQLHFFVTQLLLANTGILSQIRPRPLPSTSFRIHHSLTTLPSDVTRGLINLWLYKENNKLWD